MNFDIVVIGGSAAGLIAAKTAKLSHPNKKVLIIRKEEVSLVPCGIPYIFSTLKNIDDNKMGIDPMKNIGIEFLIEEVTSIDTESKYVTTNKNKVSYEKLIIATGSTPFVPPIKGVQQEGVFTIPKDYEYLKTILKPLEDANNIVVIGAGFIGVEVSDELRQKGKNVTLIEAMDRILPQAFDKDITEKINETLTSKGLKIMTGEMVEEITGNNNKISGVTLKSGKTIKADAIIMSIGYRPNTKLAKEAGINIGKFGAIWTDEYQRTSVEDVFAAGDCAEHKDFFTRKANRLMLASTATYDARIAGMNLYKINLIKQEKGNISIFSSAIDGLAMGAAGITESTAISESFNITIGKSAVIDRHPGTLPGKSPQIVKLIFSKSDGILLGAQVITGLSAGELINILGVAIQQRMTAMDLATLQFGTHPLLTAAPTVYPIVTAAESVARQLCCDN